MDADRPGKVTVTELQRLTTTGCDAALGAASIGPSTWVACTSMPDLPSNNLLAFNLASNNLELSNTPLKRWKIPLTATVLRMDTRSGTDLVLQYLNTTTNETCWSEVGLGEVGTVVSLTGNDCKNLPTGGEGSFGVDNGGSYFSLTRETGGVVTVSGEHYDYKFAPDLDPLLATPFWVGKSQPSRHYFSLGYRK